MPIQKNRRIVAPRDDVKDLSLIVEFQLTLRMKFHDKLMNALSGDAKTFGQLRPAHRPIECVEQTFRGRTGNGPPGELTS